MFIFKDDFVIVIQKEGDQVRIDLELRCAEYQNSYFLFVWWCFVLLDVLIKKTIQGNIVLFKT